MPLETIPRIQTTQSPVLRRRLWNYVRWSSDPQSWGASDERQTENGRKYADEHDMEFIDRYRDEGVSGYKGKNAKVGSLSQFLKDIGSNDPPRLMPRSGDAIGVDELSRLGRDEVLDASYLVKQLLDKGISIAHYRYNVEFNRERLRREPWLNDMLIGELNRAHNESYQKGISVADAKESARKRGREKGEQISGRACPGWLILTDDGKHYQEHPERGPVVRMIFTWADDGVSEGEIARRLNQMGIATFAAIGRKRRERIEQTGWHPIWYPASVHQQLVNRAVIGWCQPKRMENGLRVYAGDPLRIFPADVLVPCDPDASEATFYRVQARLKQNAKTGRGQKNKYKNIVAGLLVCGVCGASRSYKFGTSDLDIEQGLAAWLSVV
jgi:DNA invertase Pin-like site-specific DNA recombinase